TLNLQTPGTTTRAVKSSIRENAWPITGIWLMMSSLSQEKNQATRLVWEKDEAAEPTAGGEGVAALSERFQAVPWGLEKVCIVLCRGNVDLSSPGK
uniref:Uncharacterized protein n=1 Tax=Anser brachyrhynchus TaxID=132585 RepID=A0A8B9C320_9AVES